MNQERYKVLLIPIFTMASRRMWVKHGTHDGSYMVTVYICYIYYATINESYIEVHSNFAVTQREPNMWQLANHGRQAGH